MKHNNNLQNILSIPYPLLMFRDITHHGTNIPDYATQYEQRSRAFKNKNWMC